MTTRGIGRGVVVLTLLLTACNGPVEVAPNVTVVDDGLARTLRVEEDRIVAPAAGNAWMRALPAGQVLVSGQGAGFLRRLTSIEPVGTELVLHTRQAGLGDAIVRGKAHSHFDFAGQPQPGRYALTGNDLATGIGLAGTTIWDDGKSKVVIRDGLVRLDGRTDLDLKIEDGDLTAFLATIDGELQFTATLAVDSPKNFNQSFERELWVSAPKYHLWSIGFVPVVGVITFSLGARFEVQADCGVAVSSTIEANGTLTGAVGWEQGQGVARLMPAITASASPLMYDRPLTVSAKVTLVPRIDYKFYGVAGFFLKTGVYGRAVLELEPQRQWEIWGGVEATLGAALKILGGSGQGDGGALVDRSAELEPVSQEWLLASDTVGGNALGCTTDLGTDMANPDLAPTDLGAPDLAAPDLATPDLASPDGGCRGDGGAPTGATVHLPFEEGAGTTAHDATGNGHDVTLDSAGGWVPGCIQNGLRLSTTHGEIADLPLSSGDLTLSFWVRPLSFNTLVRTNVGSLYPTYLFGNARGSNCGLGWPGIECHFFVPVKTLWGSPDEPQLVCWFGGDVVESIQPQQPLATGLWYHVIATHSAAGVSTLYINGRGAQRTDGSGAIPTSTRPFSFGTGSRGAACGSPYNPDADLAADATIDELRIYPRLLSSAELVALRECSCSAPVDMAVPEDLAVPRDLSVPTDLSNSNDLTGTVRDLSSDDAGGGCGTNDLGQIAVPPEVCAPGFDDSGAGYNACGEATCQKAWFSADPTGGTYHTGDICKLWGYRAVGAFGTIPCGGVCDSNCGDVLHTCSAPGGSSFNGLGQTGSGLNGPILQGKVMWTCVP